MIEVRKVVLGGLLTKGEYGCRFEYAECIIVISSPFQSLHADTSEVGRYVGVWVTSGGLFCSWFRALIHSGSKRIPHPLRGSWLYIRHELS